MLTRARIPRPVQPRGSTDSADDRGARSRRQRDKDGRFLGVGRRPSARTISEELPQVKPLVPQSGRDVCQLSFSAIVLEPEKFGETGRVGHQERRSTSGTLRHGCPFPVLEASAGARSPAPARRPAGACRPLWCRGGYPPARFHLALYPDASELCQRGGRPRVLFQRWRPLGPAARRPARRLVCGTDALRLAGICRRLWMCDAPPGWRSAARPRHGL